MSRWCRFGVATALLSTACTMGTPPQTYPAPEPIAANASLGRVWDTAVDYLTTTSTPIRTIERASGLIVTDPMVITDAQGTRYADCGKGGIGTRWVADRVSYNIRTLGDSTRTTIRIIASFRQTSAGVFECVSRGVLEAEMAKAIKDRAERR